MSRDDIWSMDFVADELADGRRFRALTVIDLFTRECLAIDVGLGLCGRDVVATLERLRFERGLPQRIDCDNGTEFVSAAMDLWAYTNTVILDFTRRGKPTDNAAIESFNGRFREECLNVHWFQSLEDAQQKIDAFRWDYNPNKRGPKSKGKTEYQERNMPRVPLGIGLGIAFGVIDVLLMLPLSFPDKRAALLGALCARFALGFFVAVVRLSLPPVATGILVGILTSLPDAIITKAYAPIMITGVVFGALAGWIVGRWGVALS